MRGMHHALILIGLACLVSPAASAEPTPDAGASPDRLTFTPISPDALTNDDPPALDGLVAAVRSLGRIGDAGAIPGAVPALEALLAREDLPIERAFRAPADVNAAVEDARWQLELAAAEALGRLGAPARAPRRCSTVLR